MESEAGCEKYVEACLVTTFDPEAAAASRRCTTRHSNSVGDGRLEYDDEPMEIIFLGDPSGSCAVDRLTCPKHDFERY